MNNRILDLADWSVDRWRSRLAGKNAAGLAVTVGVFVKVCPGFQPIGLDNRLFCITAYLAQGQTRNETDTFRNYGFGGHNLVRLAVASLSQGNQNTTVLLTLLAVPMGIVGLISLIRACLHDHEMSIGAASRLEFLEELVYLERLTLERKERFGRPWQTGEMAGEVKIYEGPRRKVAA